MKTAFTIFIIIIGIIALALGVAIIIHEIRFHKWMRERNVRLAKERAEWEEKRNANRKNIM